MRKASTLFKPGQSGNPNGRPKGAKNKLAEDFVKALSDDFAAHGVAVIEKVRLEAPTHYLKVCASLVPKDFHLTSTVDEFSDLSDEELNQRIADRLAQFVGVDVQGLTDAQLSAVAGSASLLLDRGLLSDPE